MPDDSAKVRYVESILRDAELLLGGQPPQMDYPHHGMTDAPHFVAVELVADAVRAVDQPHLLEVRKRLAMSGRTGQEREFVTDVLAALDEPTSWFARRAAHGANVDPNTSVALATFSPSAGTYEEGLHDGHFAARLIAGVRHLAQSLTPPVAPETQPRGLT